MKTPTKWIIGIAIGGVILVCFAAVAVAAAAFSWFDGPQVMIGHRTVFPLFGGRVLPFDDMPFEDMPFDDMPHYDMPMIPRSGFSNQLFYSNFPFRLICLPVLCLGFLFLAGIVGLVLLLTRRNTPQPTAPPAPTPEPAPVVEPEAVQPQSLNCESCGQPLEEGWSHCPHCGAPTSSEVEK